LTLKLVFVLILKFCEFNIDKFYLHTDGFYINGLYSVNRIGDVIVTVLTLSDVGRGVELRSGHTKDTINLVCLASPLST
jgi:hypothetical protein